MPIPVPEPTFWEDNYPRFYGIASGRYVLLGEGMEPFLLPVFCALDGADLESLDSIHQAPGSLGGVRTGFGNFKPLTLDFGTESAGLSSALHFDDETNALAWERQFHLARRKATRIRDTIAGEEYDGFASRSKVAKNRFTNWRKLSFVWQALDAHGWNPQVCEVSGTPADCFNGGLQDAFPYMEMTATGSVVTVSDGTRTLTLYTTAGHALTVDTGRADGTVTDNAGRGNYSGRFPRIAAGGGTITVTGAENVLIRYREPI